MSLYADGWYFEKDVAETALDSVVSQGARPVGLIESAFETWGILYWSGEELFENHRIDSENVIVQTGYRVSEPALQELAKWKAGGDWPGPQWRRYEERL